MTTARELLAQAADELDYAADAQILRKGRGAFIQVNAALRAIQHARALKSSPDSSGGEGAGETDELRSIIEPIVMNCGLRRAMRQEEPNGEPWTENTLIDELVAALTQGSKT